MSPRGSQISRRKKQCMPQRRSADLLILRRVHHFFLSSASPAVVGTMALDDLARVQSLRTALASLDGLERDTRSDRRLTPSERAKLLEIIEKGRRALHDHHREGALDVYDTIATDTLDAVDRALGQILQKVGAPNVE